MTIRERQWIISIDLRNRSLYYYCLLYAWRNSRNKYNIWKPKFIIKMFINVLINMYVNNYNDTNIL